MLFSRVAGQALGALIAVLMSVSQPAAAEDNFPTRPVKIVVPASAGGDTDIIARQLADLMTKQLGQVVLVENKPGAGGMLGTQAVVNAPPDGYTIGLTFQAATVMVPHLFKKMPFDPTKDLVAIGRLASTSNVIIAAKDSPLKSLSDLIAQAKQKPGSVTYATWGVGTGGHLAGVQINQQAKVDLVHVPYKGVVEVLQAVMAGDVPVGLAGLGIASKQWRAGNIRVLALLETNRSDFFPGVPTAVELGYPIVRSSWFGLIAPAHTPSAVVAKLESALLVAARNPAMASRLADLSLGLAPLPGADFARIIKADFASEGQLMEAAGIQKQ